MQRKNNSRGSPRKALSLEKKAEAVTTADRGSLPRISVVVPSYNQGHYLAACLQSIVAQGYPNLQLMVMDGGSTDASLAIIESYRASIDHWQSRPDGGQASAINEGMARADGELIYWLNSDDLLGRDAL